jgi:hypothetical protein
MACNTIGPIKTENIVGKIYSTFFNKQSISLQLWLNERIKQAYGRDSSLVYYDVTNYYLFDYYDDVLKDIGKEFGIDFSKRIRSLGEIKKISADTKK